ncbi:MAG TPA: hypothetical protein VIT41_10640 [Microlunatus sp.]
MARLVAGGSWRYPLSRPERTDHGWLITLDGPGEEVIPCGVLVAGDNRPLVLDTSVDDAYLNLDRVSRIDDEEEAAEAFAAHARHHPVSRFLCHHGLPMWHAGPDPCRMLSTSVGTAGISLSHVRTMMAGLRGLEDLAGHIVTEGRPAGPALVAAALRWPILPTYLTKPARAETERDGELFLDRCRQLVTSSLRVLQDASLLRRDVEWIATPQLQLVAHAHTDLGLYAYAFTRRLLRSASEQQPQQGGDGHRHDEHHQDAGPQQQRDHGSSEAGQHRPVEGPVPVAGAVGEPHHHQGGQHGDRQEAGDPLHGGVREHRLR